ncbi:hypothetical protein [Brevundimonas sp.]
MDNDDDMSDFRVILEASKVTILHVKKASPPFVTFGGRAVMSAVGIFP